MSKIVRITDYRPRPPVPGATPVYIKGKHSGWLMPQVREYHNDATRRAVEARSK